MQKQRRSSQETIALTNLDSVLKSRGTILLTKVCTVKIMFFPEVMDVRVGP